MHVSRTCKVSAIHVETQTLEFALVAVTSSDPQDILHMELKWSTLDKKGATSGSFYSALLSILV